MTAPLQYGTPPASDPTAVMGRRTLAWIADLLLFLAVVAAGFASMSEYTEIPTGVLEEEACELFEQQNPGAADSCVAFEGDIYLLDTGESGVQTLLSFGWFAFFVIIQGLTGGSPGKLLFGLRVVDQYGARAGIGKSLGRTLMWVVDAAPWIIPIVGPIAAYTSAGHRRVGDLAAGTYVVSSSSVGQPVMPDSAAIPAGQTPWGAVPPTSPPPMGTTWQAPPAAPPPTTGRPDGGDSGRWSPPTAPSTPDLDFSTTDVPPATERVDEAPPTVAPDPDWSRAPDLHVEPPAAPEPAPFAAPGADGPP
ncbi:MAG TPA: RDD family protein, partial [Acidimicrobiales bacterium]